MPSIFFEGQRYYVPAVYTTTRVASSLPGPLPAFHIPVILGSGTDGHPFNADDSLVTGETAFTPFKLCNTDSACADYFGTGSELHRGMKVAKRHALPFAYMVNLSAMTRASIIADTVTSNVEQFTLYARRFGPRWGWTKIGYATNTLTIVPVKRYAMLSANLGSSATRAYVTGGGIHDWLTVGATVTVGANDVAGVSRTILATGIELDSNGQRQQWVELSSAVGSAVNTSAYGLILQYDTDKTYTVTGMTTSQLLIDYFNDEDQIFRAVKHANFTGAVPATVASPTPLKEITAWGTATAGTSPAVTGTDLSDFIELMNAGGWDAFAVQNQVIPQTYLLLSGTSTLHATMRDYATAERVRGWPISVTTGCRWGDVVIGAGDDTDPTFRAAALNSQDVMLAAGGLDREAAYLSLAAALFGRRVSGGPGHNLTNDDFLASELEVRWDEINSGELSTLCKKGVATYKLSIGQSIRYRLSQGLSTLQANNGLIWNVSDATTWSVMQRDLADFVDRVVRTDFEESVVGADAIDANAIAAILQRRASRSLEARGHIKKGGFRITAITLNDAGNGYDVAWSIRLPDTVDFITFTTTILIGE